MVVGDSEFRDNSGVSIRGKLISEISPTDILNLIRERTTEDGFIDFKAELLDPRKPRGELNKDEGDWVADLVSFANAQGGHIIVGIEADDQERASGLRPMTGDHAKKLADALRDLAIAHVKPNIVQLEIRSVEITSAEWIVAAGVPDSERKPHMSSYNQGTRFAMRDGARKREMQYDEIRRLYLSGPEQERMAQIFAEVESINSRLGVLERELQKRG